MCLSLDPGALVPNSIEQGAGGHRFIEYGGVRSSRIIFVMP